MDADSKVFPSEALAAALAQLVEIAREQEALQTRLLGVQAGLPATAAEIFRFVDIEEMDLVTEIRSGIGCVLQDMIEPAIRELRRLAGAAGKEEDPREGKLP
jgi:hypothetical protein